ncbi:MAG: hypothetical protein ACOX4I_00900 [Anaerovoracaceae bacterium]|jgi:uncharacterized protein YcaQ
MHKIKLVPDKPFFNHCDIAVIDMGGDRERQRCKITVDYGKYDVEQLKSEGKDLEAAMRHYKDWLYNLVRINISDDWECVGGGDEVAAIIRKYVEKNYSE